MLFYVCGRVSLQTTSSTIGSRNPDATRHPTAHGALYYNCSYPDRRCASSTGIPSPNSAAPKSKNGVLSIVFPAPRCVAPIFSPAYSPPSASVYGCGLHCRHPRRARYCAQPRGFAQQRSALDHPWGVYWSATFSGFLSPAIPRRRSCSDRSGFPSSLRGFFLKREQGLWRY